MAVWQNIPYEHAKQSGETAIVVIDEFQEISKLNFEEKLRSQIKGDAVKISKEGDKVILETLERNYWPEKFWDNFTVDQDFITPEALPSVNFSLD